MAYDYLTSISAEFGVHLWLLVIVIIWSLIWKAIALWKSARKNQIVWFIIFIFVNTIGILEILYIFVFPRLVKKTKPAKKKTSKKKK